MTGSGATELRDRDQLDEALDAPLAVVFKHSPYCGLSAMAARQVETFMEENPDVPVWIVDVIRDRAVSRELADRVEVRHESPQALVLREGTVSWHGSHRAVTTGALEQATG